MSRAAVERMIRAKRDPISPSEWVDGYPHLIQSEYCLNCGGRAPYHYALVPKPSDAPIYARLVRDLAEITG